MTVAVPVWLRGRWADLTRILMVLVAVWLPVLAVPAPAAATMISYL